jgi:hypothetical protein
VSGRTHLHLLPDGRHGATDVLVLYAILEEYGLLLSQLSPNSLLALAIFWFVCEAFVGVHPLVALFRHHYNVRLESGGAMTGRFTFRLHNG